MEGISFVAIFSEKTYYFLPPYSWQVDCNFERLYSQLLFLIGSRFANHFELIVANLLFVRYDPAD